MKRQNMGRGEDRISNLPDPILQSILCMMPLKAAIRTSTLSKRWRNLWEYSLISSTTLEFGNEFSCNQSPKQFVSTLSRYLHIHESEHLEKFRILFSPFDLFFRDIETWIGFAVSKGVKQLDIDLSQGIMQDGMYIDGKVAFLLPNSLFECNTLTNLSLSRCDIASPFDMSRFHGLRELSLSHVNITNAMLERMLVDCRALESLSIKSCSLLSEIRITGPELGLQKLTIMDCFDAYDLEISAPKLQSLIYYGWIYSPNVFNNISSLVDACIYSIGRVNYDLDNDNIARWISDLSHVKVLTLCSVSLMGIAFSEEYGVEELPIELQNLQELQLVMDSLTEEHLLYISAFFQLCPSPFLEKLFIQLPGELNELIDVMDGVFIDKDSPGVLFNHLKVIKVTNFRGFVNELRLVKFLLEKAVVLESLVLVTPQNVDRNEESNNCQSGCEAQFTKPRESLALKILQGQLLLLSKASNEARIVLREFSEDDHSLNPTHSILYTENVIQVPN